MSKRLVLCALVLVMFAWQLTNYYFVSDDAFISFRYARNLADGHGLVFNPGERVEGYTNFLWVLVTALLFSLGTEPVHTTTALGILCGALVLLLTIRGLDGTTRSGWAAVAIAPLALASNRTFAMWSAGGLESQCFTLFILAAFVAYFRERNDPHRRPYSAIWFALAVLTRPEANLFFGLATMGALYDVLRGRRSLRAVVGWAAIFVGVEGAHMLWRLWYYGYPLPNTFYAKVTGLHPERGALWLGMFLRDHHVFWWAPLLAVWVVLRRDFATTLMAVGVTLYCLYLLLIGGGHLEYRLLVPILPWLAWLGQESTRGVASWMAERWSRSYLKRLAIPLGLGVVLGFLAPHFTGFDGRRHAMADFESLRWYTEYRTEDGKFLRQLVVDGLLPADTLIAVGGAGALPYYSQMPTLDFRGLNDARIAHEPARLGWMAGHEKWASMEYLRERNVAIYDVVNRIVLPEDANRPQPQSVRRSFYDGPVSAVSIRGRNLMFATLLDEAAFRETFSAFEILFYQPALNRYTGSSGGFQPR